MGLIDENDERLKPGAIIAYGPYGSKKLYEVKRRFKGYVDVVDCSNESWDELKVWQILRSELIHKAGHVYSESVDSLTSDAQP